eukprot:2206148-Rhodomonas_salina.2
MVLVDWIGPTHAAADLVLSPQPIPFERIAAHLPARLLLGLWSRVVRALHGVGDAFSRGVQLADERSLEVRVCGHGPGSCAVADGAWQEEAVRCPRCTREEEELMLKLVTLHCVVEEKPVERLLFFLQVFQKAPRRVTGPGISKG